MSQAANAFYTLANGLAAAARALAEGNEDMKQHPLVVQGFDSPQLMVFAEFVAAVGHAHANLPDPDSVGAYVDRFAAKQGSFPMQVTVDPDKELDEGEYRLSALVELARIAKLPAAVATADEIEAYREHPLVRLGVPSLVYIQLAENSQSIGDNAAFADIATKLMSEDPATFGPPPSD